MHIIEGNKAFITFIHHSDWNIHVSYLFVLLCQPQMGTCTISTLVLVTYPGLTTLLWPPLPATQCVRFTKEHPNIFKPMSTVKTNHCGADMSPSRSTQTLPLRDWHCVRLRSTQVFDVTLSIIYNLDSDKYVLNFYF